VEIYFLVIFGTYVDVYGSYNMYIGRCRLLSAASMVIFINACHMDFVDA